jgi:ubiquinone/menaquinone biosynthesis C-methylase UbiE
MTTTKRSFYNFDSVAQDYDATRGLPPEIQHRIAVRVRDTAALSQRQVLLDAGVGTGRFALPLAHIGVSVIGIDISTAMLAQTQKKCGEISPALPLVLARADLRYLPLKSHSVEAVLFVHILHLITEWQAVLDEAFRVLIPGGAILLVATNSDHTPAREYYVEQAKSRGLLAPTLGTRDQEVIYNYLKERGATVEPQDTSDIRWSTRYPLRDTLAMLERRTWSSLWSVSDADNAILLADTEAWALQTYGSLDTDETSNGDFRFTLARCPIA